MDSIGTRASQRTNGPVWSDTVWSQGTQLRSHRRC